MCISCLFYLIKEGQYPIVAVVVVDPFRDTHTSDDLKMYHSVKNLTFEVAKSRTVTNPKLLSGVKSVSHNINTLKLYWRPLCGTGCLIVVRNFRLVRLSFVMNSTGNLDKFGLHIHSKYIGTAKRFVDSGGELSGVASDI